MSPPPLQGVKLHHRDESSKVVDLGLWVLIVDQSRQVEELGTLSRGEKVSFSTLELQSVVFYCVNFVSVLGD